MRILRDLLKAGIISEVYVAEGVNGSLKSEMFSQRVGSRSRVWIER